MGVTEAQGEDFKNQRDGDVPGCPVIKTDTSLHCTVHGSDPWRIKDPHANRVQKAEGRRVRLSHQRTGKRPTGYSH